MRVYSDHKARAPRNPERLLLFARGRVHERGARPIFMMPPAGTKGGQDGGAEGGNQMEFSIVDTLWVLLAANLVFFMNLGFASVESGFARAKNTVNILSKNFIVFAISSLGFMLLGWGLMFGGG